MNDSMLLKRMPPRFGHTIMVLSIAAVATVAVTLDARAQTAGDLPDATYRATRGVFIPGAARAGESDATAVELNPGQLGMLQAGDLAIVGNLWRAEAAMPGRGAAVFLAAPVWGGGGVGLGFQGIAGSGAGAVPAHTKFQLGYGIGGRTAGIGVTWGHLFGGGVGGTDTFDVGAGWRPWSGVGFGFVVEDVARPRLGDAPAVLPRRWVGELALRPFGTNRLEIGAAGLHLGGDPWSKLISRFRLVARTGGAWRVLTDVELAPRRAGALPAGSDSGLDWRATVGLVMDFDHGSLTLAARRSFTPAGVPGENWGGSLVLHTSTERNSTGISVGYVARVTVEGVDTDREFVKLALRLRALANDTGVAAVFLKADGLEVGLGRVEELRDLVAELRQHGKPVIAYLTQSSMKELYLASACDKVIMHPAGELTFAGMAQSVTFYKGAMDRLGINVELVRIAEYKGAMEPYVMTGQSPPVRLNRNDLLDDLYARVVAGISEGRTAARQAAGGTTAATVKTRDARPLDVARMGELVAVGSFTPAEAREAGLIDAIRDDHEVKDYVREYLGMGHLDISDPDTADVRPIRWARPRVAVVLLDGTITDGSSQSLPLALGGVAGADTLVAALDECRRDHSIRAVVLRVNSPGGSAFSSDVIARAVARVRAAGKPVVASMADVAASGGYYVSAPTDVIFAEPSTTTGSIGIFGFKVDLSRLLSLLSINVEVLRRGPHADQQSPYRPWTPEERGIAERKIRHLYDLFLQTVAAGRKSRGFTPARVDEVGRGRVWTGAQARKLGLVDEVGGVAAAIDRAASLGGIVRLPGEAADLEILPRPTDSIVQTLMGLAAVDSGGGPGADGNGENATGPQRLTPPLRSALRLAAPYLFGPGEGVEARLPFELDIR